MAALCASLLTLAGSACTAPTRDPAAPRFSVGTAAPPGTPTPPRLAEIHVPGEFRARHPEGWPPAPLPVEGFDQVLLFVDPSSAGIPGSEIRLTLFFASADATASAIEDPTSDGLATLEPQLDAILASGLIAQGYRRRTDPQPARLAGLPALELELEDSGVDAEGMQVQPARRAIIRLSRDPAGRLLAIGFEAESGSWAQLSPLRDALLDSPSFDS